NRHSIKASFGKTVLAVVAMIRPPLYKCPFGEHQMCPREHTEQMAAVRVVPRWPKTDYNCPPGNEQSVHLIEDGLRVGEMLEGIKRHDDIRRFVSNGGRESDAVLDSSELCIAPGARQTLLTQIDAQYVRGTSLSDFDGLVSVPTAEVDHFLALDVVQ